MPALSPVSDVSVDWLTQHFSSLKLDGPRKDYQLGKLTRPALCELTPTVGDVFLDTSEGRMLTQVVKVLIKNKRLKDKTPQRFFNRMNDSLKDGTCYGEAQSIMLSRRPKEIEDSGKKIALEFVDAVFFQVQHELSYFQRDDLEAQKAMLCSKVIQLVHQSGKLTDKINNLKAQARAFLRLRQKNPNQGCFAKKIQGRKQHVINLNAQIKQLQKNAWAAGQKIVKVQSKIANLTKKIQTVDGFKCALEKEAAKKWSDKKLEILDEEDIERGEDTQDEFVTKLGQELQRAFQNSKASDFLLTFADDLSEGRHAILVQPTHPRLYDANVGEVTYDTATLMVQDLQTYCKKHSVNCVEIQSVGTVN